MNGTEANFSTALAAAASHDELRSVIPNGSLPRQISGPLARLLTAHPAIEVVWPDDHLASQKISEFMNEHAMELGKNKLNILRGNDFFSLLRKQGRLSFTFIAKEQEKIVGLASCVFRDAYVAGTKTLVGYQHDLRLSPRISRGARAQFYSIYAAIVRDSEFIPEVSYCKFYYAAILNENAAARKVLSRENSPLQYAAVSSYKSRIFPLPSVVSGLFGKESTRRERFECKAIEEGLKAELNEFFARHYEKPFFGAVIEHIESLLSCCRPVVLRNKSREIEAACLLGNSAPDRFYQIEIPRISSLGKRMRFSGVYPMFVTFKKGLSSAERIRTRHLLAKRILGECVRMKAAFMGYVATDSFDPLAGAFRFLPRFEVKGTMYRVVHRDQNLEGELVRGFLRPADKMSLELGLI